MEEKNLLKSAGSHAILEQAISNHSETIEVGDFFAQLLPNPEEAPAIKDNVNSGVLNQLFASTISQEINLYHLREQSESNQNPSNKALQASSLVGRSILAQNNLVYLEANNSVKAQLKINKSARHVLVYVENEDHDIIRIIPLGDVLLNDIWFTWDGNTRKGVAAPEGEYKFIVSAICESRVVELPVFTYNKVIRASFNESKVIELYFENDMVLNIMDVAEILND